MESLKELYAQGLAAMPAERNTNGPTWATSNGWDGIGLWAVVSVATLEAAVGGLKVVGAPGSLFSLMVKKCSQTYEGRIRFFSTLEHNLINVVFVRDGGFCTLAFYGGTLELGTMGQYYISGEFGIKFQYNKTDREVKVVGKLVLQGFRCCASLAGGDDWVEPFEVTAKLALSSAEVAISDDPDLDDLEAKPETASERRLVQNSSRSLTSLFRRKSRA